MEIKLIKVKRLCMKDKNIPTHVLPRIQAQMHKLLRKCPSKLAIFSNKKKILTVFVNIYSCGNLIPSGAKIKSRQFLSSKTLLKTHTRTYILSFGWNEKLLKHFFISFYLFFVFVFDERNNQILWYMQSTSEYKIKTV